MALKFTEGDTVKEVIARKVAIVPFYNLSVTQNQK
jgi:hypothetical protein